MQKKRKQSGIDNIRIKDFITRMDLAYSIADTVISRAGAIAVSELCIIGKPVILVPSPNVAEGHQTKNAMFLADKNAALLVTDNEAESKLIPAAVKLIADEQHAESLRENCKKLGIRNSTVKIVDELYKILK
jgi:UDP-N-acetylglucosamine--N-acetylmuramyl-(pentapeptide) pyrophosphoryl-undecaprenol N-acetylglucosamine transferase